MTAARPHILVVDDDERMAAILREGLAHTGYVVDCAEDGRMALAAALRQKLNAADEPDLIHAVRGVGYVLRAPSDAPDAP